MDWEVVSEIDLDDTGQLVREVLAAPILPLPECEQKIGASFVRWWDGKPGDAVVMASDGSQEDRTLAEQVVAAQLYLHGYKRAQFTFDQEESPTTPYRTLSHHAMPLRTQGGHLIKTADWPSIMQKAKRLIQSGNVTLLRNGTNNIVAHVIGDHGEYNTEIGRDDPNSRTITTWQCECPWDQYAWQRTRKWKKYEGRPCAHVLAAYWKSLATPLDDTDEHGDIGTGQKMGPPPPPAAPGAGGGGKTPAAPPMGPPAPPPVPSMPGAPPGGGPPPAGLEAPMAPPAPSNALPPSPMEQLQMLQPPMPGTTPSGLPAPPGSVSVPGAKMPTPFNPMQWPGGTYSSAPEEPPNYREATDDESCGGCKMFYEGKCWGYGNKEVEADHVCDSYYPQGKESRTAANFNPPEIVRLKSDAYGKPVGQYADGQYQMIPEGTQCEVIAQDPTTGWIELLCPLDDNGQEQPSVAQLFVEPSDIEKTAIRPQSPFIRRRT